LLKVYDKSNGCLSVATIPSQVRLDRGKAPLAFGLSAAVNVGDDHSERSNNSTLRTQQNDLIGGCR
jgi:hypothetical protein